ncbi:MAG TPA: hypothetical protein VI731_06970, partial [Bacteroidia bacterium]|nr:hypothetical protein [Bacteroidia bacterium]
REEKPAYAKASADKGDPPTLKLRRTREEKPAYAKASADKGDPPTLKLRRTREEKGESYES